MSASILIVEDESDLSSVMADYVIAAGYTAKVIADGREALASVQRNVPDLIVLDIMLPSLDGLALCKAVREFSEVPIIMVTARVQEIDRLLGLESGADDYLCKPFSPRELVARIKAILRRARKPDDNAQLVKIDEAARSVRIRAQLLDLTPTEYSLLAAMVKRPGTIFSRAQLLDLASRDNLDVTDRAIDSHIKNLRRKLAAVIPDAEAIHSVYGLGYRFEL
ncbi:response regulator [Rhodanobacter glycinis]|uniref:Response regulator n=1 Tax=Rhodanobacter glycinis TaxID=582702 RepID=A0A502BVR5_9GAMM|nr:response regulator [Rhodanobacter glycinis]TPG05375.1 response regulator [Rhodanobacter glycinis]TPG45544.1 response regulator [Rhodanobacter glycinis]